jgi:hypothetical protein
MKENKSERFVNLLYLVAAIGVLSGAFFKLQHYLYGSALFFCGFLLGTIAGIIHISGLKKRIKMLEEQEAEG